MGTTRTRLLCPSMVCSDLSRLGQQVQSLTEAGVDMLHWDIMDGVFVHSFCLTPGIIKAGRPYSDLPFDVHVCVTNPESYITEIIAAGGDVISLQYETTPHIFRAVESIHKLGKKAGVVLNPKTPLSSLEYLLDELQMVTLMTVDVGFAGQKFIRPMLRKISALRDIIVKRNLDVDIQVDGQINAKTFRDVILAGANVLIVGTSGLFTVHEDLSTAVRMVREQIASIREAI